MAVALDLARDQPVESADVSSGWRRRTVREWWGRAGLISAISRRNGVGRSAQVLDVLTTRGSSLCWQ